MMKGKQLRRDLLDAAHQARAEDDFAAFHEVWEEMSRFEQTLYDVEEWEQELKWRAEGRILGSFMPEYPPQEQLKRLDELEQFCADPFSAARIEKVRQTRCHCDCETKYP